MRPPSPTRRGLTTLELLIALVITSLTGLAVTVVTTSIARGVTANSEARGALQRALAAHVRLRSYTSSAHCVLDHDPDRGFVLWQEDSRANGRVNLSEVRVFWFDPEDPLGEVAEERVVFPEAWDESTTEAADIELTPVDDHYALIEAQRLLGFTERSVVADGVAGLTVAGAGASLTESVRVRIGLDVATGEGSSRSLLLAFGLPGHKEPL